MKTGRLLFAPIFADDAIYETSTADLAVGVAVAAAVYAQGRSGATASTLQGLYFVIGGLIDGSQNRLYPVHGLAPIEKTTAAIVVFQFCISILGQISIRRSLARAWSLCSELHQYLNFYDILSTDDLGQYGIEFDSRHLLSRLSQSWPVERRETSHSLFFACMLAWKVAIFALSIPRLLLVGFTLSLPWIMYATILSAEDPNASSTERAALVGAILLAFGGIAVCRTCYLHMKDRLLIKIRGGILSLLFGKLLKLRASEARKQVIITLVDKELEKIASGLGNCLEIPFACIEASIGMYFLSSFAKLSYWALLLPMMFYIVYGMICGKYMALAGADWTRAISDRVAKTSRVLAQLPGIKLLGLGPKVADYLEYLQVEEISKSRRFRYFQNIALSSNVLIDMSIPALVLATGLFNHAFGREIPAAILYPTLSITILAKEPIVRIHDACLSTMTMISSFEQLREFLNQEEHIDPRLTVHHPRSQNGTDESPNERSALCILRFSDADISPHGLDTPLLKNVSFSIFEGSVTIMLGPTSSGKTTLLQSMLGEADVLNGSISIDNESMSIVSCEQSVWLPEATVRQCIVGACEYDAGWMNTVVIYCQLLEDLRQLSDGEDHVVGSDGTNLSGGQRQRIAIARAVYARKKAIILDDVFSCMDLQTTVNLLTALCGKDGLLRESNCTVILSSYSPACVDVADQVLLLDGNGTVNFEPCHSGTKLRSELKQLLNQTVLNHFGETASDLGDVSSLNTTVSQGAHRRQPLGAAYNGTAYPQSNWSLFLFWVDSIGRVRVLTWSLFMLVMATSEPTTTLHLKQWTDIAPETAARIIIYAASTLIPGVLTSVALFVLYIQIAPRGCIAMHRRLTNKTTRTTLGFLGTADSGSLLSLYSQGMHSMAKVLPGALYNTIYCCHTATISVLLVVSMSSYMAPSFFLAMVSLYHIKQYYVKSAEERQQQNSQSQATLTRELRETSLGLFHIRGSCSQQHSFDRYFKAVDESQRCLYRSLHSETSLDFILEGTTTLVAALSVTLSLFFSGTSDGDAIGVAYFELMLLSTYLKRWVKWLKRMEGAVGTLSALDAFLKYTPTEASTGNVDLPDNWPSEGEIELRNVSARYLADASDSLAPVLRDISLKIDPGKKIGIMGRSGGGKSTLLSTILGCLETSGSVTIDGIDIKTVDPDELRSRIVTISQDLVVLDGTIRDNLLPHYKKWDLPGNRTSLSAAQQDEAARRDRIAREALVRLRIWDPLERKQGLDTPVEDSGFSHGELQLLGIARAVVKRRLTGSAILLVDEATGSVDPSRDQTVREMMLEYFRGCTMLVVAHREETIADSNKTCYIEGGRLERVEEHW